MIETLIISGIVTWIVLGGLTVALIALARQIGVLHDRIKPVGALSLGKAIKAGETAPEFVLPSLSGGSVTIGGQSAAGKSTLLFFLSPTCPVCKTLLPALRSLRVQENKWLRVVLASDGGEAEQRAFLEQHALDEFAYVLSRELGMAYQISKLPYAVLIDSEGSVAAHGLINNREHLESLFEAHALGFPNMQELQRACGTRKGS